MPTLRRQKSESLLDHFRPAKRPSSSASSRASQASAKSATPSKPAAVPRRTESAASSSSLSSSNGSQDASTSARTLDEPLQNRKTQSSQESQARLVTPEPSLAAATSGPHQPARPTIDVRTPASKPQPLPPPPISPSSARAGSSKAFSLGSRAFLRTPSIEDRRVDDSYFTLPGSQDSSIGGSPGPLRTPIRQIFDPSLPRQPPNAPKKRQFDEADYEAIRRLNEESPMPEGKRRPSYRALGASQDCSLLADELRPSSPTLGSSSSRRDSDLGGTILGERISSISPGRSRSPTSGPSASKRQRRHSSESWTPPPPLFPALEPAAAGMSRQRSDSPKRSKASKAQPVQRAHKAAQQARTRSTKGSESGAAGSGVGGGSKNGSALTSQPRRHPPPRAPSSEDEDNPFL